MEATFQISQAIRPGHVVVTVAGEVDVATAPTLRSGLEAAIDEEGSAVIVDLLGVTFIDSTALGVLIGALKKSDAQGGVFRVVVAEPRIIKIFEITGLTDLFSISPTVDEAIGG